MRSCGEAGREREVRRVDKNLAYYGLEREASSRRIVAPSAVIVDPNADGSKRPSALDNQIKVIPDAIDVASSDQ
jgi:hypothetical protein